MSFTIESDNDSIHLCTPAPFPLLRRTIKVVSVSRKICFMDLVQLDKFIEQLNHIRSCVTPGCTGVLAPVKVSSIGLGGAVSIKYKCNGCANHEAQLETSSSMTYTIPVT